MTFPDPALDKQLIFVNNIPYQYDLPTHTWNLLKGENGSFVLANDQIYVWHNGCLVIHNETNKELSISILLRSIDYMIKDWVESKHSLSINEAVVIKNFQRLTHI